MRLIAERLLSPEHVGSTYMQGEMINRRFALPSPRAGCKYHIFCSMYVPGGDLLLNDVAQAYNLPLVVTSKSEEMDSCEAMLVYLTRQTWTSSVCTTFAREVDQALASRVRLLLAHEMPGLGGQFDRDAVEFSAFFAHTNGATPQHLLKAGIYSHVAVPLKGGDWRAASLAMLAAELIKPPLPRLKRPDATEPISQALEETSIADCFEVGNPLPSLQQPGATEPISQALQEHSVSTFFDVGSASGEYEPAKRGQADAHSQRRAMTFIEPQCLPQPVQLPGPPHVQPVSQPTRRVSVNNRTEKPTRSSARSSSAMFRARSLSSVRSSKDHLASSRPSDACSSSRSERLTLSNDALAATNLAASVGARVCVRAASNRVVI